MGSFNIACGASKLSIECGDKVAVVLISKRKYSVLDAIDSTCNISGGIFSAFNVISLPLFGEYDDYGNVNNFVEDDNYNIIKKFIEKHSYSFDEFLENIFSGDAPMIDDKRITAMFIHGDVYDKFLKIPSNSALKNGNLSNSLLTHIGFHKTDEDTKDENFKYMFRYKDTPIEVHCSGERVKIVGCSNNYIYFPQDFKNEIKKLHNIDIDISSLVGISKYNFEYDVFRDDIMVVMNTPNINKSAMINMRIDMDINSILNNNIFPHHVGGGEGVFSELYFDKVLDNTIKEPMVNWVRFCRFLNSNNTLIMPSYSGTQCGDYSAFKMLANIMIDISNTKISESYEDDEEYNED